MSLLFLGRPCRIVLRALSGWFDHETSRLSGPVKWLDTADKHRKCERGNSMLCTCHVRQLKSGIKMKRITQTQ